MNTTDLSSLVPDLPLHNGVSAWWAALRARKPALTYAYVMGMTGGAARTAFCGIGCMARDWLEVEAWQKAGIEGMGWRIRPVSAGRRTAGALWERLSRALERGRPVPWFLPEREGVLIGCDTGARAFLASTVTATGEQRAEAITPEELLAAQVFLLSRSREPKGRRSIRETNALAGWAAYALRPPLRGGCALHPAPAWAGVGLAAYELWADALERAVLPESAGRASASATADRPRMLWWLDTRRAAAAFCLELAGKQRTPWAVRLRRAAECFAREAAMLKDETDSSSFILHPSSFRTAAELAAEGTHYVLEAALLGLRLPPELCRTLLEPPDAPLPGTAQHEMIYLARAGTRPLRQLAARRLAGSHHSQTVATLAQLLYDPDGPTSETALWALERIAPPGRARLFADAFRSAPREGRSGGIPLQRALLFAVADTQDGLARNMLREALDELDPDDPETILLRKWASEVLY
jgi:hypothetical protein